MPTSTNQPPTNTKPHPLIGKPSLLPLACLLLVAVFWIALEQWTVGGLAMFFFLVLLDYETPNRRLRYIALAASLSLLAFAPIHTATDTTHIMVLGTFFTLALVVPAILLRQENIIIYKFLPDHIDRLELFYTALSIPLAWGVLQLYLRLWSPYIPYNWHLPPVPENEPLVRLFLGINGVGIWDELFFINTSYAIIRSLFPYRIANPAQAIIYTAMLWDMAFRGVGPWLVYAFALTQGAMYERSRVLLWVLIVHLIVDFFLFRTIVSVQYPHLDVWWH